MRGSTTQKHRFRNMADTASLLPQLTRPALLLPGAFLVAIGAQLFAPFMFINFAFATFF
jgi:hypothetical protein